MSPNAAYAKTMAHIARVEAKLDALLRLAGLPTELAEAPAQPTTPPVAGVEKVIQPLRLDAMAPEPEG
jgi:hypothetical protein